MMRKRYIITALTFFLFIGSAFSKPVKLTEVREAVYTLLDSWNKEVSIEKIEARFLQDGALGYYMVDLGQEGWVMVSADDAVRPVLAFSFENSMPAADEWKEGAAYLINQYKKEISVAIKDQSLPRNMAWDRESLPSEKKAAAESAATVIDPIIDVAWDQGGGWNMFCPVDEAGPSDRVYVGCVAVAMAQAMSVHKYPVKPKGIKSYVHEDYGSIAVNYDMADPYNWNEMSATSADSFNAMLLYHCAVAVEMDFGADGSGAFVRTAASSLIQYFNYSRNVRYRDRFEDAEEWEAALVEELAAGRPIVYRGQPEEGTSGHAWNLDGYSDQAGTGSFHMNFGWSGSNNGYFTLDNIAPGSYEFNSAQGAIFGMAPPFSTPYDLELSEMSVAENLPDSSFVADVLVEDEDPNNTYSFTCMGAYSIFLDDYGPASFFIEDGKLFTDKVFVYDDDNPDYNNKFLRIIVEDQYGNEYTEDFEIAIEKVYTGPTGISLSDSSVMENKAVGTAVAKVILEDEESSNSYTYTLYGAYNSDISDYDPASFYMDGDSLRTSLIFDRNNADTCFLLVEVHDAHENQLSRAFTIQIQSNQSGSTGINHISLEDDLLYPNPANRFVTLRNTEQNSSLEFYEITGRKISTMNSVSGSIDVSGLGEGIYLVVIRSQKGTALQKLLIQR